MNKTNFEMIHRLEMIEDDVKALLNHLKKGNSMGDNTIYADDGHTHINNIHIALDPEDNECLTWGRFNTIYVKDIIKMIKEREVDGEHMQYILEKTGMDYQMYKQLNVKY